MALSLPTCQVDSREVTGVAMEIKTSDYDRSDVNRLLMALNHREPDRLPHVELWVTSQAVYEYVLERKLDYVIGDAATYSS